MSTSPEPPSLECPDRPSCVSSRTPQPARRVAPLTFCGATDAALERLATITASLPGGRVETLDATALRATFRSRIFGFVDDVHFVVREPGVIDVRSKSRVGYYDFGVNRARVEKIRTRFEAAHRR